MRILRRLPCAKSPLSSSKRLVPHGIIAGLAALLAACQPVTVSGPGYNNGNLNQTVSVAQPTGEVLGSGSVRVALLTPMSAQGIFGQSGKDIRNAAALAIQEYNIADLQVIVKDVGAGPTAASQQAGQALAEGAQLVIGPLQSDSVKQAGRILKPAGVPMIAMTKDTGAAAQGVYLINFSPENDVERILSYAAAKGKRSIAAIVPTTPFGNVVEAALRQDASRFGLQVVTIEKYQSGTKPDPFGLQKAAEAIGQVKDQIDTVFIPDPSAAVPAAQLLAGQGVRTGKITFLGLSDWDTPAIAREPMLKGAWYPAPPRQFQGLDGRVMGYQSFASRYAQQYGTQPARVAALAYDSIILAAVLVAQAGERRFSPEILTDPNGFIGSGDGFFRFRADGTSQRSLAINEISNGTTRIIDAAPLSAEALPR